MRRGDRHARGLRRAVRRDPARRHLDVDDDQRPGGGRVRLLPRRGRAPGRPVGPLGRDPADRHPQGVHRPEGVELPATAAPPADRRPDGVLPRTGPALAPDQRLRVPHPRGRGERVAGARVHAGRRVRVRRARAGPRARRRSVRAGPVLLLQRARRLLRGDREVPRRAPDLGEVAQGALRREGRVLDAAAVPHADGGGLAHRSAADEQRRADGDRGHGRRPGRHPVAAHERARRGPGAADRGGGEARAPDPTDHRARDGRPRRDRPPGRLVLPRDADGPDGGAGRGRVRAHPRDGRGLDARGGPHGYRAWRLPAGDRGVRVPRAGAVRARRPGQGRRDRLRRGGGAADRDPRDLRRRGDRPGRAAARGPRAPRCGGRPGRRWTASRSSRRTDANLVEPLVDCARALCTEGEIVEALRTVFGSYTETPRF